jgi:hypothetical protein
MKRKTQTKKFRTSALDIAAEKWIARRGGQHDRTINVYDATSRVLIATAGHSFSTDVIEHRLMPEVAHERLAARAIAAVPEMMAALIEARAFVADRSMESNETFELFVRIDGALSKAGLPITGPDGIANRKGGA